MRARVGVRTYRTANLAFREWQSVFSGDLAARSPNPPELDPALGDLSLYRTRQLVPPHRMEELRRGEVMIVNWHRLAKKETTTVNGDSAKVVKTGEPVEVVKNAGKANETVETKYSMPRLWNDRP